MTLQEINQRISILNEEGKRLNNERQVNIGKRQTLEAQLKSALEDYRSKYGVVLTVETLDAEIARVSAQKEGEIARVESLLGLIRSGRYSEADRVAKGECLEMESAGAEDLEKDEAYMPPVSDPPSFTEPPKRSLTPSFDQILSGTAFRPQ